jgi:hypothetical protein
MNLGENAMNKYKVLAAMLNLVEFTVEDLATFSGVKLNTVRVVLARHENLVQHVRTQDTGQRGGQFKLYRVKDEQLEQLRLLINNTYTNHIFPPNAEGSDVSKDVPISLRATEDVLKRRFPQEKSLAAKRKLFDLAEIRLESARQEIGLLQRQLPYERSELLRFRLQSAESLLDLCMKELAFALGEQPIEEMNLPGLLVDTNTQAKEFVKNGDSGAAASLLGRVIESPVLAAAVSNGRNVQNGEVGAADFSAEAHRSAGL